MTLDTTRADFISAYQAGNARTPALDSLARDGTLFENAYCLIPITLPSHASMFFSEPPHDIKNYNNGQILRPARARPSLAVLFRKAGFASAAFVSLGVLTSRFGLEEGFEHYGDAFPPNRWYLSAAEVNVRVLPWLEANRSRGFFLWVHYSDPHDPYAPPGTAEDTRISLNGARMGDYCLETGLASSVRLNLARGENKLLFEILDPLAGRDGRFAARLDDLELDTGSAGDCRVVFPPDAFFRRDDGTRFLKRRCEIRLTCPDGPRSVGLRFRGRLMLPAGSAREGYGKEVEFMDREIGKLLEELRRLGLYENTAIMAVGDHGEGLGEYRTAFGDPHVGHVHFLNPVYMKVPFLFRWPGAHPKGVRRPETVTLLDVAPTAAAIMGLKAPASFKGRNLLDLPLGQETAVFEETFRPEAVQDRFALQEKSRHLIFCPETGRYEYFDLGRDPDERAAVTLEDGLPAEAAPLKDRLDAFVRDVLKNKVDVSIDGRTEEMLKSLGYVGYKKKGG
jgi:arylsulfatase A-like enzyme